MRHCIVLSCLFHSSPEAPTPSAHTNVLCIGCERTCIVLLVLRPKPTAHATMVHDPSADKKNQLIDSRTGALERLEQLQAEMEVTKAVTRGTFNGLAAQNNTLRRELDEARVAIVLLETSSRARDRLQLARPSPGLPGSHSESARYDLGHDSYTARYVILKRVRADLAKERKIPEGYIARSSLLKSLARRPPRSLERLKTVGNADLPEDAEFIHNEFCARAWVQLRRKETLAADGGIGSSSVHLVCTIVQCLFTSILAVPLLLWDSRHKYWPRWCRASSSNS